MTCPKCQGTMRPVTFAGIEIDRCSSCGGLWFDILEHEDLKKIEGSERIDTAKAPTGLTHDTQKVVHCPRDGAQLIPMVDRTQPHIWFESCPVCYGAYFDAGEFRDLRELTFLERFFPRGRSRPP